MDTLILGLVSNCWREQLRADTPLEQLIGEAVQRGYGAIELRQTCLGEFETGTECLPDADALRRLSSLFSDMQFNVAVALPFLSPKSIPAGPLFQAGLSAALGVCGRFTPHLRMVDLTTHIDELCGAECDAAATAVAALSDSAAEAGVMLSLENSIQPWNQFRGVFRHGLSRCRNSSGFRLCYDPANLLLQPDPVSPAEVTRSLVAHELSMVHFKQRAKGRFLPSVRDGDIDWRQQLDALAQIEFSGPALFEIESSADVWQSLEDSRRYLQAQGGGFALPGG